MSRTQVADFAGPPISISHYRTNVPTSQENRTTAARTKETTVPGVHACGDAALPQAAVTLSLADGVWAGVGAHQSLVFGH